MSSSKGLPNVCAKIIALVLDVIADSIFSGEAEKVGKSMSINVGIRLFWKIGLTVVGNPAARVITSSPEFNFLSPNSFDIKEETAKRFAEEPELVVKAKLIPIYFDNCFSNS